MARKNIVTADLMSFLNVSITSTGQAEYYNTRDDQWEAIVNAHLPVMKADRLFYALMLLSDSNELNKMVIATNLLKSRKNFTAKTKRFENQLIVQAFGAMSPKYKVRLFEMLRKNGVNLSARTIRWVVRQILMPILSNPKLVLINKNRLEKILASAHIGLGNETNEFIFGKRKRYHEALYNTYLAAAEDAEAMYKLPFSVAEGFRARHDIPKEDFLARFGRSKEMSNKERVRSQSRAKREGAEVAADLGKLALFELLKYLRSQSRSDRPANWKSMIGDAADKAAANIHFRFQRLAIVVDNSGSGYGSREKKFHPLLLNLTAAHVLKSIADHTEVFLTNDKTGDLDEEIWGTEFGDTNIAKPFVEALKSDADAIVILSDGYENSPSLAFQQVIDVCKREKWLKDKEVLHLSPVTAAEHFDVRRLHDGVPASGFRNERLGLPLMLLRAQANPVNFIASLKEMLLGRLSDEIRSMIETHVVAA